MKVLEMAMSTAFEVLARIPKTDPLVKELSDAMIEFLDTNRGLIGSFLDGLTQDADTLDGMLVECGDKLVQKSLVKVISFAFCALKEQGDKAIASSFLQEMRQILLQKAYTKVSNIAAFNNFFVDALLHSAEEVRDGIESYDADSEAFKNGMKIFYEEHMI